MWKSENTVKNSIVWKFSAVLVILLVMGCMQELISPVDAGVQPNGMVILNYNPSFEGDYSEVAFVKQNGVVIHIIYIGDIDTIPAVMGDSLYFSHQQYERTRKRAGVAVDGNTYRIWN